MRHSASTSHDTARSRMMTGLTPQKHDLARRFGNAVQYDQAARVQKHAAEHLAQSVQANTTPHHILEIGCGTGFLSAELAQLFPQATLCLTDLAPDMLTRTRARLAGHDRAVFMTIDGENPPSTLPGPFDLIASNLCVQWFHNRADAFRKLVRHLAPGGRLCLTTLAEGSLDEWRTSCVATDTPCGVPHYPSSDRLQQDWPSGGQGRWQVFSLTDPAPSARHFLHTLRQIGASQPDSAHHPATPGALRRTMSYFDTHHHTTTYHIALGIFQKDLA